MCYNHLPVILAVVDLMVAGDRDDRLLAATSGTAAPVISTSRTAAPVIGTTRASSPILTTAGQCATNIQKKIRSILKTFKIKAVETY